MGDWTTADYARAQPLPGAPLLRRAPAGGAAVLLACLAGPVVGGERPSAGRLWGRLASPYVLRLLETGPAPVEGVLAFPDAPGGSLSALLAHRRHLEPGEVVTIAVPVAEALAAGHAGGAVHGALDGSQVLFSELGMPLLVRVSERPAGAGARPEDDVQALAALCCELLGGAGSTVPPGCPGALGAVLQAALSRQSGARPSAAALAVALRRAQAAAPVRLHDPPQRPAGPAPAAAVRHGSPSRWLAGVVGVVAVLLCAGLAWARHAGREIAPAGSLRPVPSRAGSPETADWRRVLTELDARREAAFVRADPTLLAGVYDQGADALVSDTAAVEALAARRLTASGVRHEVRRVEPRTLGSGRAELTVVDRLGEQVLLDATGVEVARQPARGELAHTVLLVRAGPGWRIAQLGPAP